MISSSLFHLNHQQENKQEVLSLQYSGRATTMQMDTLLDLLEKMLINEGLATSLRRRLYCIAMEALQNLSIHVPDQVITAIQDLDINPGFIKFNFQGADNNFRIETSNYILKSNLPTVLAKIDKINTLDEAEQKEFYNHLIKNLPFSEKGGAGLGLVDIARKSKLPLRYVVQEVNPYYSWFTLAVQVQSNAAVPVSAVA